MAKQPTRDDVARLAGTSTAVVSYVVNGGPRNVRPETRKRVLEAIEQLGYRPNASAQSLSRGRSDLFALLVPGGFTQRTRREPHGKPLKGHPPRR